MKIIIACSKEWFVLDENIKTQNDVICINENSHLSKSFLDTIRPDFIFFPHWNWHIKKEIYENFECVIFHTAPLPYGRGGTPIQNLILKGFEKAPVCALRVTSDYDAGPIFAKKIISLKGSLTKIFNRINVSTNKLIIEIIQNMPTPVPQKGKVYNFNRRIEADNEVQPDIDINGFFDLIRMLDEPSYPKSFLIFGNLRIEFSDATMDGDTLNALCRIKRC
tara:strand:+ start:1153 stop:1815 length:663 start_codon:yes stop_codon:yes gene_type:complete